MSKKELEHWYRTNENRIFEDFFKFLRFPSVSSEKTYKKDIEECADWLVDYLKKMGFEVELWKTKGHPTLFAKHLEAGKEKPTLLIYNHYDVQPVDPIDKWVSSPFDPVIRGGEVFARGAQDNKGQCFYTLQALKGLLETTGTLPINIKLCIEGEEECGSVGLSGIIEQKKKDLKADYLAIVDLGIPSKDMPAVTLGVRGLVTMDVEVKGTRTDLHSGSHGGMAYNPIHALVGILSELRDEKGKIRIPQFYDDVIPLTDSERQEISFEFSQQNYEETFGASPTGGESGIPPLERMGARPTIEVNGISGGYSGEGFKTVIPSQAFAKVSCRLVPNQDPLKIGKMVARYIEKKAPKGVTVKVNLHTGKGKAVRANPASVVVRAFADAYTDVFEKPCRFIFEGGSIPVVTELAEASEAEVVLLGLGLGDDQIHAPNEHFGVDRIFKGFQIMTKAIQNLGACDTTLQKKW